MARHIAFTGHAAGSTYCGDTDRSEHSPMNRVQYAVHLPYLQIPEMDKWVEDNITCGKCKTLYHSADE